MISFFNKLADNGVFLKVLDGKLKVFSEEKEINQDLLKEVKVRKEQIISYLQAKDSVINDEVGHIQIPLVESSDSYPISDAQRRLWILSQFSGGSIAYNMPSWVDLYGDYHLDLLAKSITLVMERHEILRTVFKENSDGEIRQWILAVEDIDFSLDYQDFRADSDPKQQSEAYISRDVDLPFDLETGPLLRAGLLQLSDNHFVFYYNMHHIISDGWSMDVLSKDVFSFYEAMRLGQEATLDPLPIQYKDYASWQLDQLGTPELASQRDYWLDQLKGNLPLIDFPTTKARPHIKTYNGATLQGYIDKEPTRLLKEFISAHDGSLFTGLLALWNVLIHKYTSLEDIVIGTPVAGRGHSDLSQQIGFYVNTLALRNELNPSDRFDRFYEGIVQGTMESFKSQMYSFDRLVEDLGVIRNPSRSALFDVMLVMQNTGEALGDFVLDSQKIGEITRTNASNSKFDLQMTFEQVGDYLSFQINYNTDIYEETMVTQLMKHFKSLLSSVMENPSQSIKDIDYLLAEEKLQLLNEFNQKEIGYPKDKTIVDLFSEQVLKVPHQTAVVFEGSSLSYSELDALSNQLAHYLLDNYGIEGDDLIGIQLERSQWLLVVILGVLKSGGAYVPIDPSYPQDRIDYILKDAQCKVCIDTKELDRFMEQQAAISEEKINKSIASNQLAYVIYTSGTTGLPKGVLLEHVNVVRLFYNDENLFDFSSNDVWCLFHSYCFDFSIWEIFGALLFGGKLVVVSSATTRDTRLFSELIQKEGVTVLNQTPSAFALLQHELIKTQSALPLRYVIFGGEALNPYMLKEFHHQFADCRLINMYGITETTVHVTYKEITQKEIEAKLSDIGVAIPTMQCHILDAQLQLVPIGVAGELYISGAGLARGYLNKPALTQERFIANPFKESDRLYKTGDLGRWLADGSIEYLGRMDHQVKIRGHRIELGEIEYQLQTMEGIHQVIVLLVEKELVAYFVSDFTQTSTELRNYLSQSLPDYMLPGMYVQLDELPLTVNGKVDRKALLALEGVSIDSGMEYVAPSTDMERALVAIWQEVLQREKIGIHDDYFVLGGNSLLALKLINGYYKEFGVRIGVQDLFEHPVLASHVALLESKEKQTYKGIPKAQFQESYPLSNSQHRLWVVSQMEASSVAYNLPSTMVLDGSYDIDCFKRAVESVIDRHDMLRTVFREDEHGEVRQWILSNDELNFSIDYHDFSEDENPQQAIASYVENDSYKLFDLAKGPLLRTALLRSSKDHYVFYYNMHHIISDGWSMEILARDVLAFYQGYKEDTSAALKELFIQYADYTLWQTQQMKLDSYKTDQTYWLERLAGDLPLVDLPGQKLRPKFKNSSGRQLRTYLSSDLTKQLLDFTTKNDGSLFIGILATLKVLLHKYTGKEDIIIGSPVAGRSHPDLQDQIGFYINNLAFRNSIDPKDSFHECYQKIKQTTLDGFSHQNYPFDSLVEDLDLQYDMSRTPVYDISLTLHNLSDLRGESSAHLDDQNIEDLGPVLSKNDVEFHVQEIGDVISFGVIYSSDLYERDMIVGLLVHFKELLSRMLTHSDVAIAELDYLPAVERRELLHDFNDTFVDYPTDKTVLNLFTSQARKTPNAKALQFKDHSLTYQELDELSNQLSHCLVEDYGVVSGAMVGIQLDRSHWFVVAILGVLKSGGAYVPIDPDYPSQRKEYMIQDAGIELLLSDTSYMFDMDYYEGTLLALDVEFTPEEYSKEASSVIVSTHDLAYIIYTSGSTGAPKGVMVAHSNLINLVYWQQDYLRRQEPCHVLQYFSFSFDGAVGETFWSLCTGCSLYMYDHQQFDASNFYQYLSTHKINVFVTIPSFLRQLDSDAFREIPNLLIVVVGEVFDIDLYKKWQGVGVLVNGYGPTENTVYSTVCELDGTLATNLSRVPIGKPISNTKVYILDGYHQLVPKGVVGELYVSGSNVAKGYLNREDLTNERFMANIFEVPYKGHFTHSKEQLSTFLTDSSLEGISRESFSLSIDKFYNDQQLPDDLRERLKDMYDRGSGVFQICFLRYLNESKQDLYSSFGFTSEIVSEILGRSELSGLSIMDLGFGNGELLDTLSDLGANVYGVDANPYFVQKQLAAGHQVAMARVDLDKDVFSLQTGYEQGSFDIVFMTLVLDRLEYPRRALETMLSLLDKQGRFCIQALLPIIPFDDGDHDDQIIYTEVANYITHGRLEHTNKLQLLTLLQQLGGGDISMRSMDYYVKSTDGQQKYRLWSFTGVKSGATHYLYKTGDLGCWLKDGNIDFMGRVDDQVKIRGHRIELPEIEKQLTQAPGMDQVVVVAMDAEANEKQLVAYFVSQTDYSSSELHNFLSGRLPDYMLPSSYVSLEAMPLTSNGKIDKKSLPSPKGMEVVSGASYVAPTTEMDRQIVEIWQDILQKDKIGLKDDYFVLGGNSLLALKIINTYYKTFNVRVSVKGLFENPMVGLQSGLIQSSLQQSYASIEQVPQQESYELSNAQERLWMVCQMEESSAAYNSPSWLLLEGDYDLASFSRAISSVIERHEILRTVFKQDDRGEVRQWIKEASALNFKIDYQDFTNTKKANAQELAEAYMAEDAYRLFDLEHGPLIRASLLKIAEKQYLFYYNMHHIISDGWSMDVLSKDVFAYYKAYQEDSKVALDSLSIQYKDYAYWQRSQLGSAAFEGHKSYWLDRLQGELPLVDLPTTQTRPKIKTYSGASLQGYIDSNLTKALNDYVLSHGGSLFTGLLTLWNIVLHKYTSLEDIVIGSPVSGRSHGDLSDQIGFYLNMLALRNKVDPQESFEACYKRINDNTLEAYDHQMYPFDQLVEELELRLNPSRSTLFDVMLVLQNLGDVPTTNVLDGTSKETAIIDKATIAKFDLDIVCQEVGDRIAVIMTYNTDVYEGQMIEGLFKHLKALAAEVLSNPSQNIAGINYLEAKEKQNLLYQFNNTKDGKHLPSTVIELFENQVKTTPNSIALSFEDDQWTYAQLDALSNELAAYLMTNYELELEAFIGIKLERSPWQVIAILGVLKAGAAYVPIEVNQPKRRIELLENAIDCKVVMDAHFIEEFENRDAGLMYEKKKMNSNNLAYVIFTSGSTGIPKGVMIEHGSLINYLNWSNTEYIQNNKIDANFGLFTSLSFDLTVTSVFLPLINGNKLTIVAPKPDVSEILENYISSEISCIKLTPAHINLLEELEIKSDVLKVAIVGGEALQRHQIDLLRGINPDIKIYNEYGPTEATVGCITEEISSSELPILIGKPILNTEAYILDANLRLQPLGIPGEICIGGDGLARGYLNSPELTSEKFIENPFKEGERLYRTGDLGRWMPDGRMAYLGRKDDQVKIRGNRVELGEIENALRSLTGISQAVVLMVEKKDDKNIIAYVVGNELSSEEITTGLREVVPDYMLPGFIVKLDAIPLTTNGKVDKKELLRTHSETFSEEEVVAPRTPLEKAIWLLWKDVLGFEEIGVTHSFFELGGHSQKMMRLLNRIKKQFHFSISVKEFYENLTIQQLAKLLKNRKEEEMDEILPIQHSEEGYAISNEQLRIWIASQSDLGSQAHNIVADFDVGINLNIEAFIKTVAAITERHEVLRTSFSVNAEGEIVQMIADSIDTEAFVTVYTDADKLSKKAIEKKLRDFKNYQFNLTHAPLFRIQLIQNKHQRVLSYVMHHIIGDFSSYEVLVREMAVLYDHFLNGTRNTLTPLKVQYKDYVSWIKDKLNQDKFKSQNEFWKEHLDQIEQKHNWYERTPSSHFAGATFTQSFDDQLFGKVNHYCNSKGRGLMSVVSGALGVLIHKISGQEDILIGLPISLKNHPDLLDQVGLYLNLLPLRVSLTQTDTVESVLHRVADHQAHIMDASFYPFDLIIEDFENENSFNLNNRMDVYLNVINHSNTNTGNGSFSEVVFEPRAVDLGSSKFPLCFYINSHENFISYTIEYQIEVFGQREIEKLGERFVACLNALMEHPNEAVSKINLIDKKSIPSFNM